MKMGAGILTDHGIRGGGVVVALLSFCGCTAATTAMPREVRLVPEPGGSCAGATLGIEAVDASRALLLRHGLPEDVHGAMVIEVLADGPAARADLAIGDVIEQLDAGGDSHDIESATDLDSSMHEARCGEPVAATIRRGSARLTRGATPVDAVRFYSAACQLGVPTGCYRQGWLAAARVRADGGEETGAALYDRACGLGSGAGCRHLARLRRVPGRAAERRQLLERSCALHDASGCVDLAFLYATGQDGMTRDDARATPLFVEACDGGDPAGCYNAGLMYQDARGVAADLAKAVAAYEDGCRGGAPMACDNLGTLYDQGRYVTASSEKAAELYRSACSGSSWSRGNSDACVNLGRLYRDGRGVDKDPARAVELFEQVCARSTGASGRPGDADDPDAAASENDDHENSAETAAVIARACSLLGAQVANGSGVAADWERAIELSKVGCDGGDNFGCFNLGVLYATGNGVEPDEAAGLAYYQRACDGDDAEACFEAALMRFQGRGVEKSREQAAALYRKACDAGFAKACVNLGGMYAGGDGVPLDLARALTLFARGCEQGEPMACFNLANHYADGTGVAADPARAEKLYRQACTGGFEAACAKSKHR